MFRRQKLFNLIKMAIVMRSLFVCISLQWRWHWNRAEVPKILKCDEIKLKQIYYFDGKASLSGKLVTNIRSTATATTHTHRNYSCLMMMMKIVDERFSVKLNFVSLSLLTFVYRLHTIFFVWSLDLLNYFPWNTQMFMNVFISLKWNGTFHVAVKEETIL